MKVFGIIAAVFIASIVVGQGAQAASPSFDCDDAIRAAEHRICFSSRLARLDRRLSYWYGKAMLRASYFEFADELRDTQRDWLQTRNSCGYDFRCLHFQYRMRIRYLRNYATHV